MIKILGLFVTATAVLGAQNPVLPEGMLEERFERLESSRWTIEGRGESGVSEGVLRLTGCEAVAGAADWTDYELCFRARAPKEAEQAQLWASVRRTARDSRYVVGLRGGNNNQVYMARYAPNGQQAFLGVKELADPPRPGEWCRVRIVASGSRLQVFLGEATEPVMEADDGEAGALAAGGISLGGGYLPAEYDDVTVRRLPPGAALGFTLGALKLNFQPGAAAPVPGWLKVTGAAFSEADGKGWATDLTSGERTRKRLPDAVRDSVVSVAGPLRENEFRYRLSNGDYLVTLWAGDPAFAIAGKVSVQGDDAQGEALSLKAGAFASVVKAAQVRDGVLRLKLTRTSEPGFSVQALVIERRDEAGPARWERAVAPSALTDERVRQNEAKRARLRAAYAPVRVALTASPRSETSLEGKWLFLPDYEFAGGADYAAPACDDRGWHLMDVPSFWTTADNWLYDGVQGGSDRWNQLERKRLGQYTFDGQRTKAAWYRHAFELESVPAGTRFELCFDAIAKVADVYINGTRVASNVGMFRPCETDITQWVRKGRNTLAVRVAADEKMESAAGADKVAAVAVTVAVTERMLGTLPHGIYCGQPGGIWQPVKLVVRREVQVKDIFFRPRLDGARVELTLENQSERACQVLPRFSLTAKGGGPASIALPEAAPVTVGGRGTVDVTFDTGPLEVALWTPAKPNLYTLCVALSEDGKTLDERKLEVGFRTFEARKDGRLYLNGKPYWLRGGSHTPMPTCPWDTALAEKFTRLMHDGNVRVTRSVCAPWNELWLSCADRNGVGVSQEGTWPWLMINGKVPDRQLLECWRQEHLALIRKYRNHPSILFWTVNNESYYVNHKDPKVMEATMTELSDTIKAMRALDPTRPICPDSGGVLSMAPPFYDKMAKEKGFDYGDIDDKHDYTSWYVKSFFQQYPGQPFTDGHTGVTLPQQLRKWVTPGRPMISQEMASGYPNADDGHSARKYIFDHMVPQAWVGDYAYEQQNPAYFLESVRLNTKELVETMRCHYRDSWAGVVHFALNCWFQNLFEAERIRPYPAATGLATALQPVLVSARLYGRHFYAGDKPQVSVFVLNDDEDGRDLGPLRLVWSVECGGQALAGGEQALPPVPYYTNHETLLTVALPERLPSARADTQLVLKLFEGSQKVSENRYELTLAEASWVQTTKGRNPCVVDAAKASAPVWERLGCSPQWLGTLPEAFGQQPVVVCDFAWTQDDAQRKRFLDGLAEGGRVLLYQPGQNLKTLLPEVVRSFRAGDGETVNIRVPESPVFEGIEVLDLRWFDRGDRTTPIAAHGSFLLAENAAVSVFANYVPTHAYLRAEQRKDQDGGVIFTVRHGKGLICVTQMAHELGVLDPVAARLLRNLMELN